MVDANGFALSTTVPVFQWAFGIYSDRYSSVQALPNGATIVVPDDGANQGQALWLLQRIGLIRSTRRWSAHGEAEKYCR